MKSDGFAVFILSHGRADNVLTYKTLRRQGYTGPIYIIIDDEDKQREAYIRNFGEDNVLIFDKKAEAARVDKYNNNPSYNVILYARNACFDIAKKLGFRYFLELDDDYLEFQHRFRSGTQLLSMKTRKLDRVFDIYITFLKQTPFTTVSFAQGGDFIGGLNGEAKKVFLKRKAMNSFFCDTQRPFQFVGCINEDVNTYVSLGKRGRLFGQINVFMLIQVITQKNKGGMTETYKEFGTYLKSFYSVLDNPSCTKITMMRTVHPRLHHQITWKYAVPRILNERYRKN